MTSFLVQFNHQGLRGLSDFAGVMFDCFVAKSHDTVHSHAANGGVTNGLDVDNINLVKVTHGGGIYGEISHLHLERIGSRAFRIAIR